MIYIRNIFTQDLRDGKQIAFPTEPSNILFKFSFSNKDADRKISFKFKEKDNNSPFYVLNGKTINTRLYSAGSEARIDGELKHFLKVDLNAKVDDVIVFRAINLALYEFELIPQGAILYRSYKDLLNGKNHEVALEHFNDEINDNNNDDALLVDNVDLLNLKENFADWFIKLDGVKHNYFKDFFGLKRDNLLEQLTKYETIYEEQFEKKIFSLNKIGLQEFILELEENLYLENGAFFQFSLKTSSHMPRAILGKKNYLKFLKELLTQNKIDQVKFNHKIFHKNTETSGLNFSSELILRFISSLTAKPFVILSGLSGSGKTKIAQSFVQWICENENQYKIVPVGADWTNREPLVGYPNGLVPEEYITPDSGVIHLLMEALKEENKNKPFFLILDEMNLSHVERYFADFLSIMESNDSIKLYTGKERTCLDGLQIPLEIGWPKNVFIIGTVNIDETTYMFSPKVLDRANVIEFRITNAEIKDFLANPGIPDLKKLNRQGIAMAESFLSIASQTSLLKNDDIAKELVSFFNQLQHVGAEFGYRSATEIMQLAAKLKTLEPTISDNDCLDIAIMQKLLPKLHGSRSKLVKILIALSGLCVENKTKEEFEKQFDDLYKNNFDSLTIKYPISFEKLIRMYKNVLANGFTSYAEA
jgi:5-methylcytosine-specific restriction protein B